MLASRSWLAVLLFACLPSAVAAQSAPGAASDAERPIARLEAVRAAGSITIDGRLDEPVWARAPAATGFVQMRPDPGAPAAQRTEARVVFDDDAVYVGMRLYDQPDSIEAQLARRDASGIFTDWAHVMIDSYHDRRTAFRFSVTPRGTEKDVLHFDDTNEDLNWDAVWDVGTRVDSLGWVAEFRIPLSQLRFSAPVDGAAMVWGVNFGREIARYGEWSWWSPVLPTSGGFVSESGELVGLDGLEAPRRAELLPYVVASATRAPDEPRSPFYEATDPYGSAGLDLKYGVTSNLTLSATLNPDFGQVEADPSVVNLSAFETFFTEKRPFFLEGTNFFDFSISTSDDSPEQLFYSRRIGRRPQRFAGGEFVDAPTNTTILGAGKLSGKTASGWSIGVLDAVTADEAARVMSGGTMSSEPVEPLTNYAVASVSRDFRNGLSAIRAVGTATHRRLDEGGAFDFLTASAYSGGLSGRHRFADGTWQTQGYVAGSHVRGGEEAITRIQVAPGRYFQRPDAEHLEFDPTRTELTGLVVNTWTSKIGGDDPWRGGIGGHLRTPGFEVNDLGFMSQTDQAMVFGNVSYNQYAPTRAFRTWWLGINPSSGWTTGGERIWSQLNVFGGAELHNFWQVFLFSAFRAHGFSPDALRGGPGIRRPGNFQVNLQINTDRRTAVYANLNFSGYWEAETDATRYGVRPFIWFRPSGWLNLNLAPGLTWNRPAWQYVGQPRDAGGTPHYVFAALDQTTASLTTRLDLTLSPTLSFQLYAQPFISGGRYHDFLEVDDPRAATFGDRFARLDGAGLAYDVGNDRYDVDADEDGTADYGFGNPDFNVREMRGTAVLRWEYLPGSILFLVWSHNRSAFVSGSDVGEPFDLSRDAGRLFGSDPAFPTPQTNVFLIKLSYWLNL